MYHDDGADSTNRRATEGLARAIKRHAGNTGDYETALPALSLHRRNAQTEPMPCIYPLSLAVTTQGGKQVMLGENAVAYGPGQSMLTTIESPIISRVTRATTHEPFLGLLLKLDHRAIAQAASRMKLPHSSQNRAHEQVSIETLDPTLLDALRRLVDLLDDPVLLLRIAPLIQQEIIIRLLVSPHGPHLQQLKEEESPSEQISRVVAWIKLNFIQPIRMDELAVKANMSPSTFRQHFRAVTGMSPLQFQKQLRLQEARQLMLNQNVDAGRAASMVGYESASQFSREYSRLFGAPPKRDVRHMRSN